MLLVYPVGIIFLREMPYGVSKRQSPRLFAQDESVALRLVGHFGHFGLTHLKLPSSLVRPFKDGGGCQVRIAPKILQADGSAPWMNRPVVFSRQRSLACVSLWIA